jgi:hypothetical protein
VPVATGSVEATPPAQPRTTSIQGHDPKQFLLDVMADTSIDLGLRIEAAKALLPCFEPARPSGR